MWIMANEYPEEYSSLEPQMVLLYYLFTTQLPKKQDEQERLLVAMLFVNCQLAAWANNAYEYLTTLLSWTRTGDSDLTCPAL